SALAADPADTAELTILRRAFHTLKGSSRMVGLTEFGEAAWSLEQVLNTWLADQKPASEDLRALAAEAMRGFDLWIADIAANSDSAWKSGMFRGPADIFRMEHRRVPFVLAEAAEPRQPVEEAAETVPAEVALVEGVELQPVAAELPAEFDFELPSAEPASDAPGAVDLALEIEGIELTELPAAMQTTPAQPATSDELPLPAGTDAGLEVTISEGEDFIFDLGDFAPAATETPPAIDQPPIKAAELAPEEPPQAPAPAEPIEAFESIEPIESIEPVESLESSVPVDEQVKVIGSLRIGIPLYNVYLNEADEWSRRLATEVAEWALELGQRLPDSTVGLAHALAGSSAKVGFHTLSDIARALESAMQQTQSLAYGTPQHGTAFTAAAEEIRRLLHQFAAGFLKQPDPSVIDNLLALKQIEIPQRADLPENDPYSDFADLELELPVEAPS